MTLSIFQSIAIFSIIINPDHTTSNLRSGLATTQPIWVANSRKRKADLRYLK